MSPSKDTRTYAEKIKAAYEFYVQSPDGQHDLFVAEMLLMAYFVETGINLEDKGS